MSHNSPLNCIWNACRVKHVTQQEAKSVLQMLYRTLMSSEVKYLNGLCSDSLITLKGKAMIDSSQIAPESIESTSLIQGIDMNPAKPKRKLKPEAPEIPEPGVPEVPSPGFPVPGFPDVAIPIVPDLPLPDFPEFPAPKKPAPEPQSNPLPGMPEPIFPEIFFPRSPVPVIPEISPPPPAPLAL